MKRVTKYTIAKESCEDMCKATRFNRCREISFRDRTGKHTHKLSAGYSDDSSVYRENGQTFVLSQNPGLGYIGLEVFRGEEQAGDIFLEAHRITEILGQGNLAPFTIIKRLEDYVSE